MHQLPHRGGDSCDGEVRSRSNAPDEPRDDCCGSSAKHAGRTSAMDYGSKPDQAGFADAGDAFNRSGERANYSVFAHVEVMTAGVRDGHGEFANATRD